MANFFIGLPGSPNTIQIRKVGNEWEVKSGRQTAVKTSDLVIDIFESMPIIFVSSEEEKTRLLSTFNENPDNAQQSTVNDIASLTLRESHQIDPKKVWIYYPKNLEEVIKQFQLKGDGTAALLSDPLRFLSRYPDVRLEIGSDRCLLKYIPKTIYYQKLEPILLLETPGFQDILELYKDLELLHIDGSCVKVRGLKVQGTNTWLNVYFEFTDLSDIDWINVNLSGGFSAKNCQNAKFNHCSFISVKFYSADLRGAKLIGCYLRNVQFVNCKFDADTEITIPLFGLESSDEPPEDQTIRYLDEGFFREYFYGTINSMREIKEVRLWNSLLDQVFAIVNHPSFNIKILFPETPNDCDYIFNLLGRMSWEKRHSFESKLIQYLESCQVDHNNFSSTHVMQVLRNRNMYTPQMWTVLLSLVIKYSGSLNVELDDDDLDRLFNSMNNGYSILNATITIEDDKVKDNFISLIFGLLNKIDKERLRPLAPSLSDVILNQRELFDRSEVREFYINKLLDIKLQQTNTLFTRFSRPEAEMMTGYLNDPAINFEGMVSNYKYLIPQLVLFAENLDVGDPLRETIQSLEQKYFATPIVSQFVEEAKTLDYWIDAKTVDEKIERESSVLKESLKGLLDLGFINENELTELRSIEDYNSLREKINYYLNIFYLIKGRPPQDTVDESDLGSGLLGRGGFRSRLEEIEENSHDPEALNRIFGEIVDQISSDSHIRELALNLFQTHFLPVITDTQTQTIFIVVRLLSELHRKFIFPLQSRLRLLDENLAIQSDLSNKGSLIFLGDDLNEACVVDRKYARQISLLREPFWPEIRFIRPDSMDVAVNSSPQKRPLVEIEINAQNPEELLKAFINFPIFEMAFNSSLNRKGLQKLILQLGFTPNQEELFNHAIGSNSSKQKLVDPETQVELNKIFIPFFEMRDEFKGAIPPDLKLKSFHISLIYTNFSITESPQEIKAYYLFVLSTIFANLSSATFFGTGESSPEALRAYSLALFNAACDLHPSIIALDQSNEIRNRLIGAKGAYTCTQVLSRAMVQHCKASHTKGPGLSESLSAIYDKIYPLGWRE